MSAGSFAKLLLSKVCPAGSEKAAESKEYIIIEFTKLIMTTSTTIPGWYKPVTILAFLWNLVGVLAFYMEVFKSDEALALLPEKEQMIHLNMPVWMTLVFFLAVAGGTIGSLGLILKKKWAYPVLVLSLIAVVIQMSYSVLVLDTDRVGGHGSAFMPVLVVLIAVGLVGLSRKASQAGWLL